MTTEREQLADAIAGTLGEVAGIFDTSIDEDLKMADAILAAGYRKPRTVTTVEELDALPAGTIIREDFLAFTKWGSGVWGSFAGGTYGSDRITLPVTVLYEVAL